MKLFEGLQRNRDLKELSTELHRSSAMIRWLIISVFEHDVENGSNMILKSADLANYVQFNLNSDLDPSPLTQFEADSVMLSLILQLSGTQIRSYPLFRDSLRTILDQIDYQVRPRAKKLGIEVESAF